MRPNSVCIMDDMILKSPIDENIYKDIVLDNGLRVLLIQTCTRQKDISECNIWEKVKRKLSCRRKYLTIYDMSAASLCIGVGSFFDPPDLPGLANLLQRVILKGSRKYDEENYYKDFISNHGGKESSSTSYERTSFSLEVMPHNFRKALDILANFFKSPLLRANDIENEIETIDDEFEEEFKASDDNRLELVISRAAERGHPMTKFARGNKLTLKETPAAKNINVGAELRKFYNLYYSANNMKLVVQATEPLTEIEKWVKKSFSGIPNNGMPMPTLKEFQDPFMTEKFIKIYKVPAVSDKHSLHITWALPPLVRYYRTKPEVYISHRIAHEGKGSIISYLKKRQWATELVAGCGDGFESNSTGSLFHINISLTEKGIEKMYEILTVVFQFLKMLRTSRSHGEYYEELKKIRESAFKFYEDAPRPFDFVQPIAENMQQFPVEHYLTGHLLMFDYRESIVCDCLDLLLPDLANIAIITPTFAKKVFNFRKTERWTKFRYNAEDVPEDWANEWKDLDVNKELFFPEPNRFISTDFRLKFEEDAEHSTPMKLVDDDFGCAWFTQDQTFKVPYAYIRVAFGFPMVPESAGSSAKMELFCSLLSSLLYEDLYCATEANMTYEIINLTYGILIYLGGLSHKIAVLLEEIIDVMVTFIIDDEFFASVKSKLLKDMWFFQCNPENLATNVAEAILLTQHYTNAEERNALLSVSKASLEKFARHCFGSYYVQSYYHGNLTEEEVIQMDKMIKRKIGPATPVSSKSFMQVKVRELPENPAGVRFESFSRKNKLSVVHNFYEIGPVNLKSSCIAHLLTVLMNKRCDEFLPKEESVECKARCLLDIPSGVYSIEVRVEYESNKFDITYIDECVDEYVRKFLKNVIFLMWIDFKLELSYVISYKKNLDLNMKDTATHLWEEIHNHRFIFNRRLLEIKCFEKLLSVEFKGWIKEEMKHIAAGCKRLSVQVCGPHDKSFEDMPVVAEDDKKKKDKNKDKVEEPVEEEEEDDDKVDRYDEEEQPKEMALKYIAKRHPILGRFIRDINDFKGELHVYEKYAVGP